MPETAVSALAPTVAVTVLLSGKVTPPVEAVTVTWVPEAFSATLEGEVDSDMLGTSSSDRVIVALVTDNPAALPETVSASLPSTILSFVGVSVNVLSALVSPAEIVMWNAVTAA